jgi:hypothetical protein
MKLNQEIPCFGFFDSLLKASNNGRFFIILRETDIFELYEQLKEFEGFVAVLYGGPKIGRVIAQETEFVTKGKCRFHFLLTTI